MALCYRKGVEDGKHSIRLKDLVARDVSVDDFPALSTVCVCVCGGMHVRYIEANVSRVVGSMVRWHDDTGGIPTNKEREEDERQGEQQNR